MIEAKYTPGPWWVEHNKNGHYEIVVDDAILAEVFYDERGRFGAAPHDARLIAAAPELLELAHQYLSDLRYPPTGDSLERRIERAKAVIAKATCLEAENER